MLQLEKESLFLKYVVIRRDKPKYELVTNNVLGIKIKLHKCCNHCLLQVLFKVELPKCWAFNPRKHFFSSKEYKYCKIIQVPAPALMKYIKIIKFLSLIGE